MIANALQQRIRVALVDDHAVVVSGIEAALSMIPDIEVVARAGTLAEAQALLARSDIAVVLLDIRLPDGNGLELLARTMHTSRPAVIVLSSFEARQYIAAAIRFGAQGFLLKTAPTADLVEAIRAAALGGGPIGSGDGSVDGVGSRVELAIRAEREGSRATSPGARQT